MGDEKWKKPRHFCGQCGSATPQRLLQILAPSQIFIVRLTPKAVALRLEPDCHVTNKAWIQLDAYFFDHE